MNVICPDCGMEIIDPDSYGDYDDACEWSCLCGGWEKYIITEE